ncbi:T9SS type A sorting domain-containing protein [Hymenobacter latericus]|uniref:T9SS type A sorting domain-containing protein n=1 Tax=Hymenobacter sp. YIM 151858-1 TaxID=2987688 RepID=UPI002226780E|nr:T9SS type A sorting domain-containing protein [Hymenobacter sp. YIM 151858-1]UYZ59618.1 T9SS type A sorting domain-containing protein [Hymenobacter sp. YIM 151858-1]
MISTSSTFRAFGFVLRVCWLLLLIGGSGRAFGQSAITPVHTGRLSDFGAWSYSGDVTTQTVSSNDYLRLQNSAATVITPTLNFANYTSKSLNFRLRTFNGTDATKNTITVTVSADNGATWTAGTYTRTPSSSTLTAVSTIDLSGISATQVKIRFQSLGSDGVVGLGIDDIAITGSINTANFSISAPTLSEATVCAGANLSVAFAASGNFGTGNVFTAQLSDASGNFANPTSIGSAGASPIAAVVPATVAAGSGYLVRVVASNPSISSASSAALQVAKPSVSISPVGAQSVALGSSGAPLTATEAAGVIRRQWAVGTSAAGPFTAIAGEVGPTYTPNISAAGSYFVVVQSEYGAPCNTTVRSNVVQVNVTLPKTLLRWDGGGDKISFADANNWSPDLQPADGYDLLLDHTFVTSAYQVVLPTGAPAPLSLSSMVVNPNGGAAITVTLPSGNTTDEYLRFTRSTDALVLHSGATFVNNSGSGTGTPVDVSTAGSNFVLYNGGAYVHRTNRSVSALLDNLSAIEGTENGLFAFETVGTSSSTLSLNGRTFGRLAFRAVAGNIIYSSSGTNALTIRGNLEIDAGATLVVNLNADVTLRGNLINNGNFRFSPSSATARPRLIFGGSAPQTISGTALGATTGASYLGTNVLLQLNNSHGLTLATPVTLNAGAATATNNGGLELLSGKLTTNAGAPLTLAPNAVVLSPASATSSYVSGPMIREVAMVASTGTEQPASSPTLDFPVGSADRLRTVSLTLSPASTGTATYLVEALEQGAPALGLPTTLERVSAVRHYRVQRLGGTAAIAQASIALPISNDDFVTNPAGLRVAAANKEQSTFSDLEGTVSNGAISAVAPAGLSAQPYVFALASAVGANNPLPVELTAFAATRQKHQVQLRWQTAQELNSSGFEVQRSTDGKRFELVGRVAAAGHSATLREYTWLDAYAPAGTLYYRMLQVDKDGSSKFSPVVTVAALLPGVVSIYPNPTSDVLRIDAPATPWQWEVRNNLGQVQLQGNAAGPAEIRIYNLAAGAYFLHILSNGQQVKHRFVKR